MPLTCPNCGANQLNRIKGKDRVIDVRATAVGLRRRRVCPACNKRFTTVECTMDVLRYGVMGRKYRKLITLQRINETPEQRALIRDAIRGVKKCGV